MSPRTPARHRRPWLVQSVAYHGLSCVHNPAAAASPLTAAMALLRGERPLARPRAASSSVDQYGSAAKRSSPKPCTCGMTRYWAARWHRGLPDGRDIGHGLGRARCALQAAVQIQSIINSFYVLWEELRFSCHVYLEKWGSTTDWLILVYWMLEHKPRCWR